VALRDHVIEAKLVEKARLVSIPSPHHSQTLLISFDQQESSFGASLNPFFDSIGHVWTVPAVQEESDVSAKRSGAAMYTAYFRLEDCLCRDAAAVAAGPDVIR
jgi:hypothetical protein